MTGQSNAPEELPKEAKIMSLILQSQGIEDCAPQVVHQLLDFAHRYTVEVFQDALTYSEHAGKPDLDVEDVRLAIQGRVNHSFTTPPPKEFLMELSEERNRTPLPLLPEKYGVRLPSEKHCLTAVNFQVVPDRRILMGRAKTSDDKGATSQDTVASPRAGS
ncbi:Transcription initiation factor TFIID subunit 9 [Dispira simplex]|nr:Transcription initiation factor TFIID subunit 9 [Dispira simplex]KAJ1659886.1 Transcription initiation factor TFIID subunit 9 [Dispira simplex]